MRLGPDRSKLTVSERPAPRPKPKPKLKPKGHEAPIEAHFKAIAQQAALNRARHAADATPVIHSVTLTPPGRPTQFFGSARPAPIYGVKNVSAATLTGDKHPDFVPVAHFLAQQKANARAADRDGTGIFGGGRHGSDLFAASDSNEAKFDREVVKNPAYKAAVNDPVHGTSNVAVASAFGLPVDQQAASKYIDDVIDAMKSGANPAEIPKLVLPRANKGNIAQLQAYVRAKGFSQDEVNHMNYGELIGHIEGPNKYTSLWSGPGGRFLPSVLNNFPRSLATGIVGFPAFAAMAGAGLGRDVKDSVKSIARGDLSGVTGRHTWDYLVRPLTLGTYEQGKNIVTHPYEAVTQDPFGTALFGYNILHGAAGPKGLGRFAGYKRRQIELTNFENVGSKAGVGEADIPAGPTIIPPRDAAPPPPAGGPTRGIEPPLVEDAAGGPSIDRPEALPPGPLFRNSAPEQKRRIDEIASRMKAGNIRFLEETKARQEEAQRAHLESPDTKRKRLDQHRAAIQEIDARINELKDQIAHFPSPQQRRAKEANYRAAIDRNRELMDQTDDPHAIRQLQLLNDSYNKLLNSDSIRVHTDARKTIKDEIRGLRNRKKSLHDDMVALHIDLNLPLENHGRVVRGLEAKLKTAIEKQRPQEEITAIRNQLDSLRQLGEEDVHASFKDIGNVDSQWFHDVEDPISPIEHTLQAINDKYDAEHYDPHNHDSNAMVEDLTQAMTEADGILTGRMPPGHVATVLGNDIADLARKHFGSGVEQGFQHMTPGMVSKARSFVQDAVRATLRNQKDLEDHYRNLENDLGDSLEYRQYERENPGVVPTEPAPNNVVRPQFGRTETPEAPSPEAPAHEMPGVPQSIERYTGPRYEAPPPEEVPPQGPPSERGLLPYEDNLPKASRDLSQGPPRPSGFEFHPDDGSRTIDPAHTDLMKVDRYRFHPGEEVHEPLLVDRGFYSRNLIDRMFQWAQDKTLQSTKIPFSRERQERFLSKTYRVDQGHVRRRFYNWRDELEDLLKSAEKLNDPELTALVQAHAQGVKPSDMRDMYHKLLDFNLDKLEKLNFPKELRNQLRDRAPTRESLARAQKIIDQAASTDPTYRPIADWFANYRDHINSEGYVDDTLFGNIVKNFFEPSFDLRANVALWDRVMHHVGDDISPEMQNTLDHMRGASGEIDDTLADNDVLPRQVMDNRRYQRQRIVSSILGREIPIDEKAIYVPDRSVPTKPGGFLFRRTRSYNLDKEFGGRVKKHTGASLISGKIDPSFSNYYTGLTSAKSKIDAVKFQKQMLDRFGHKVGVNQVTYDGDKFVLYDGSKGVPHSEILTRAVLNELNARMGGTPISHLTNEQRIRYRNEQNPGAGLVDLTPDEITTAKRGDLYLIPRPIYDSMLKPITGAQFNNKVARLLQRANVGFRTVALKLRPAYLPVNTAESSARAMAFGSVNPITVALDISSFTGHRIGRAIGVPEGVIDKLPKSFMQKIEAADKRGDLTPEEIKRTTYSGNIVKNPKLGSLEPQRLRKTRLATREAFQRLDRSPTFGPTMKVARFVAGGYGNHIFSNTARAENYMREMMIYQKLLREARSQSYKGFDPRRYFKGIDEHMLNVMQNIKEGKDATLGGAMDNIVKEVYRVLGDFSGAENKFAQTAWPFYRWTAFITKFVLWESPVHYPGRTLIMHQLGRMGSHQLAQMGLLPQNIQGAYPVSNVSDEKQDHGPTEKIIRVMYTQAWNGPSTVVNLLGIDPQTGTFSSGAGLARQFSPFIQAAFAATMLKDPQTQRELQDATRQPLMHDPTNVLRIFTSDVLKAMWPVVTFGGYDYGTMSDNSIPIFDMIQRKASDTSQPQSSPAEQMAAILLGTRRRPLNLTRLQQQNMNQAFTAARQLYKSLGDPLDPDHVSPAQKDFNQKFRQYYHEQLQVLDQWVKLNGDPGIFDRAAEPVDIDGTQ